MPKNCKLCVNNKSNNLKCACCIAGALDCYELDWDMVPVNIGAEVRKSCSSPVEGRLNPDIGSPIDHPAHYAAGRKYEPIDVINDWNLDFALGNTIKYISRAGRKDKDKTLEDLKKAKFYLDYTISNLDKD